MSMATVDTALDDVQPYRTSSWVLEFEHVHFIDLQPDPEPSWCCR